MKLDAGIYEHPVNENGRVKKVRFHCVPSFVLPLDQTVKVPGLGEILFDLALGGASYAYAEDERCNVRMVPAECWNLIRTGIAVNRAVVDTRLRPVPGCRRTCFYSLPGEKASRKRRLSNRPAHIKFCGQIREF